VICGKCKGRDKDLAHVKTCYGAGQPVKRYLPVRDERAVANVLMQETMGRRQSLPDVPAGHYAVPSLTGNNDLDFFRVDRPTEGKWAGRTFVNRVIGGRPSVAVPGVTARQALEAIRDAGPEEAKKKYGQEIGRCGECNRHLTDELSRSLGIGPVCRGA
jgi:hypothetical protein